MNKVLIIEDQKEIREVLEEVFRKELGFKDITFACDGLEGFAEASLQKFDIICTDHSMPFFNGGDLIFAIRNKIGLNQTTPIIMISSFLAEVPENLLNLEDTYYVDKPIDFVRLTRYVKMANAKQKS